MSMDDQRSDSALDGMSGGASEADNSEFADGGGEVLPEDEQHPTEESGWAAEEARQDSDMTIGTRADAELPEMTEGA